MSSLSQIFLMHLKATSLHQSSEISIVQDNANSSCNSLSKYFRDSSSMLDASSDCSLNSSFSRRARRRPSRRRSSCSSSRWEPAVAIEDDLPLIPTRQGSNQNLMANEEADDDGLMSVMSVLSACSIKTTASGRKTTASGRQKPTTTKSLCSERSQHRTTTKEDSRPRIPRRQRSKQNLMAPLPRIPRRQNSFQHSLGRTCSAMSNGSITNQEGRRPRRTNRRPRRAKSTGTPIGKTESPIPLLVPAVQ